MRLLANCQGLWVCRSIPKKNKCKKENVFLRFKQISLWIPCGQISSVTQLHLTLCSLMDCSTPGSLSITNSQSLLKLMSIKSVMPSNHLIFCHPLLQSFPTSGSFPMSLFFTSGGQSIGASASVLPVNIQDWFPLVLTGLIFLQFEGLSRVFSSTTVQKHQYFSTQLSYILGWKIKTCDPEGKSFKQAECPGMCVLFFF